MQYLLQRLRSIKHATHGLWYFFGKDAHGRLHLLATIATLVAALLVRLPLVEFCILLLCCGMVLAAEMINHAIEKCCDLYGTAFDKRIAIIKDTSAAAVWCLCLMSCAVGGIIFLLHFLQNNF